MTESKFFPYDACAIEHLCRRDGKLKEYIEATGRIERRLTPDLFEALAGSIIAQQISGRAADTVSLRLQQMLGGITPAAVAAQSEERIQQCGMSHRKAHYIKSAAHAVLEGRLPLEEIPLMDDEEIIRRLDALPGIGRWTAEMLLIFSLGRQDVLSYDDLGIRRGLMKLHGMPELSRSDFSRFRELYSPYGSVASLYLWHIAGQG